MGLRPSINYEAPLLDQYINTAFDKVIKVYEALDSIEAISDLLGISGSDGALLIYDEAANAWIATSAIQINSITELITVNKGVTFGANIDVGSVLSIVYSTGAITGTGIVELTNTENAIDADSGALRVLGGLSIAKDIFLTGLLTAGTIQAGNTTITGTLEVL